MPGYSSTPCIESQDTVRMIGNVAHDLKTPLSAFSGEMDIICDDMLKMEAALTNLRTSDNRTAISVITDLISSVQQSIANMRTVNTFMVKSINRCIDYTKATTGVKLAPRPETVNVAEVVDFSLSCIRNAHSNVAASLKPSATMSRPTASHIITDKQWLQENILCLLSNAVKYSSRGDITLCTTLYNRPCASRDDNIEEEEDEFLRIEVEDSGIGVSPEVAATLFQPFQQAQAMAGGTGLGLYSLALRVAALGGHYGVSPRCDGDQGSVFWFDIPYRPDAAAAIDTSEPVSNSTKLANDGDSTAAAAAAACLNVLLVDDSHAILRITGTLLKRQGHMVTTAENGAEAVSQLEIAGNDRDSFDVVLMDLQMPVMDGLEATRRIRQSEAPSNSNCSTLCCASTETVTETFSYIGLNHSASLDTLGFLAGNSNSNSAVDITTGTGSRHTSPKSANGHVGPSFRRAISTQLSASGTALQQHPARRTVIIGVSANGDRDTVAAAYVAGVDAFIPKPFTVAQFNETYAAIMREKAQQQLQLQHQHQQQ